MGINIDIIILGVEWGCVNLFLLLQPLSPIVHLSTHHLRILVMLKIVPFRLVSIFLITLSSRILNGVVHHRINPINPA